MSDTAEKGNNPNLSHSGVITNQPVQVQQQPILTQMPDGTILMFPQQPIIQQVPSSPLLIQPQQNPALQWSSNIRKDSTTSITSPSPGATLNAVAPMATPVRIIPYSPYGSMINLGQPAMAVGQNSALVGSGNPKAIVNVEETKPKEGNDEEDEEKAKRKPFLVRFAKGSTEGIFCCMEGMLMFCECAGTAPRR